MIITDLSYMETVTESDKVEGGRRGKKWKKQKNYAKVDIYIDNYVDIRGNNNDVDIDNDVDVDIDQSND